MPHLSFRQLLAMTFAGGIFCLTLVSSIAISNLSSRIVRDKLIEQGRQATETFAGQSTLALLYASADNAKEPAKAILGFPSVQGVAVYDTGRRLLFAQGASAEAKPPDDAAWPDALQLELETPEAWYFVAPVYSHRDVSEEALPFASDAKSAQLLGFVRLVMGKDTLLAMERSILHTNLVVAIAFASVFLLILLGITKRLTTPLQQLAQTMDRASAGEKRVRADVRGAKDIINMEIAFNTMMGVLETREQQLEKARDAALESARLKGEFAANVSHELRTPLNAVLGMLELLRDMGLTAKQAEYVDVARGAGDSLLKLIEDILDFSRIEAGMMKLYPSDFVLHDLLDDVMGLLDGQARRKQLDLSYEIADDVPVSLRGEASRLRQVLINLVGNAIKFTEKGSIGVRVSPVAVTGNRSLLRFDVVDTGIGIAADVKKDIFEAFVQADGSSTRRYEGTGLGLAICRQLVALMGGDIGVESEPTVGSRFWFTLPFDRPIGTPALAASSKPAAAARILIVTGDEKTRQFLSQMLARKDMPHHTVEQGPDALEQLRAAAAKGEVYRFVIVDLAALGESGLALVRVMAQDLALVQSKVILLVDRTQDKIDDSGLSNVAGRLEKPVRASQLYGHLLLPAGKEIVAAPAAAQPPSAAYPGKRILVVEDNRASQEVAIGMLERLGCRIDVAGTGLEAVEKIGRFDYDLVLMDCHMPVMDGFEATGRIRALAGTVAQPIIVAMTANTQKGDSDRCLAAGMDDYLAKPLKLSALKDKLQQWLGDRQESPAAATGDAPPSRQGDERRPLDEQTVRRLREEIGDGFSRMAQVFFEDTPDQLEALGRAVESGDASALCDIAHGLKGAAMNLGANRFGDIARQLESLGRSGTTQGSDELLGSLFVEYECVTAALRREVAQDAERLLGQAHKPGAPLVLIADDDRAMRCTLHDLLQKDGYRIEQASSGAQALALCERQMPDLLLLDAMMPEMDGFTVCARLRQRPEALQTPIIIVTSLDDEGSIDQAFSAGATDYVPKPVHFAVLRQRVARLLDVSRAEEHLNRLAYGDLLTGLPNRALFLEKINTLLSGSEEGRQQQMHAILFLDLDRFKLTNDTLGHEIGDRLLQAVSERIQNTVRKGDLVARFGGDEFTLLLENIGSPQVAAEVSQKICQAMAKPFVVMGYETYVGASIGISVYPVDGSDSVVLVKHADIAMYRAKERGNTYRFYEEGMDLAVSARLRLEGDLRRALEGEELFLHYQPQFDIRSGRIIGMEALVRWQHPERGLIPPLEFIPLAEETGLIESLGEWVLRSACAQNKAWQQAGLPCVPVAVNLSARQFEGDDMAAAIMSILEETGLEAQYLELELTESTVHALPGKIPRHPGATEAARHAGVHRRFRHGVFQFEPAEILPLRQAENRQVFRQRRHQQSGRRRHCADDHRHRHQLEPQGDRRRRGNRPAAELLAGAALPRGAGLLFQQAGGRRPGGVAAGVRRRYRGAVELAAAFASAAKADSARTVCNVSAVPGRCSAASSPSLWNFFLCATVSAKRSRPACCRTVLS